MKRRNFLHSAIGAGITTALASPRHAEAEQLITHISNQPLPVTFLTQDHHFADQRPCFSPDGKSVLFMRVPANDPNNGHSRLFVVPTAGGPAQQFFDDPDLSATRPDWSWTNGLIAFAGIHQGVGFLFLLNSVGGGLTHVPVGTPPLTQLSYPAWYPDGRHVSATNYANNQALKIHVPTGDYVPLTNPQAILAGMTGVCLRTAIGNPIALAAERPGAGPYDQDLNQIWLQWPNGELYMLDGEQGRAPWWSPSGNYIVFESNRDAFPAKGPYRIFIEPAQGGHWAPLTPQGLPVQHAKFSPDGRLVVFAANLQGGGAGIALVHVRGA